MNLNTTRFYKDRDSLSGTHMYTIPGCGVFVCDPAVKQYDVRNTGEKVRVRPICNLVFEKQNKN